MELSIDFETRSRVDLRKTGVYPYATDPSTDIWCMAYAFGDEPVHLIHFLNGAAHEFVPGGSPYARPRVMRIFEHVESGGALRAWNAQFERLIWTHILGPRYGFPIPKLEQFYCTAAEAAAMALPRALDQAASVLNVDMQKDAEGKRLMMQMAKPRKPTKKDPREWWDDADRRQRLYDYCMQDVRAERAVAQRVRRLSGHERAVYLMDQRMNDRGVLIDVPLVLAAQKLVDEGMRRANAQIEKLTAGAVDAVTKAGDLTRWLQYREVGVDNVRKDTLRDLLGEDDLPPDVREVVELRTESAKSSTAKLTAMLLARSADDRARGLHLYHGAGTGRWAGKLIQPQNFPRGEYWNGTVLTRIDDVEGYIPLVLRGEYDLIDIEHPTLVVVAALLRRMLRAAPGHRLMAGDYSQIEARVLAWIAEQDDLLEAFAKGAKIYEPMGARIYGVPVESVGKDSLERQIGKNTVLGAGFQMGGETFRAQVKVQTGIDLPEEVAEAAIRTYRTMYPRIRAFWREINDAAIAAVREPGCVTTCGRNGAIRWTVRGEWLFCVLPSGRPLCYALPQLRRHTVTPKKGEPFEVTSVTFAGVDGYTRKWRRHFGYGGLFTENVVQAMARDLMASAMLRLDAAGYRPILTVHDEVVCEPEDEHGSLEEYLRLMQVRPRWAAGLPVAVDGWEGERYRK